jgi:hypothetical protein
MWLGMNENANREQAVTKQGEQQYGIVFPKYKKGGYIVRKVFKNPTYGRFNHVPCSSLTLLHVQIISKTYWRRHLSLEASELQSLSSAPDTLSSGYERPEKSVAIQRHKSRFQSLTMHTTLNEKQS